MGAINRVPAVGEARSNLHVGGRAEKAALTGARPRHLSPNRPGAARCRFDLRRHRCDRRLVDRNQRDLAYRFAGGGTVRWHQSGRGDLGCDRTQGGGTRGMSLGYAEAAAGPVIWPGTRPCAAAAPAAFVGTDLAALGGRSCRAARHLWSGASARCGWKSVSAAANTRWPRRRPMPTLG